MLSRAVAFRLAVHLVVWAPFLSGVAQAVRLRWRPVGDGAAIAVRSWEVLTAHGPLVGQANRLADGAFDPGPLQYWLQAVPVHLDPRYGVLWGAALCVHDRVLARGRGGMVGGRLAGGLVAAGSIVGILTWQPVIALQPFWNPWFGAMFFLAALAAGWAVLSGRRRWWVVLVVTGSVASQAHLMYALASAALILLALAVTVVDCLRAKAGYGWATAGLLAGLACWTAPVIQEFTGRPGNLTLLLHGVGSGQLTGLAFGFKTVTAATQPPPLWWTPGHALAGVRVSSLIADRSAVFAVAALAVVAAVLVIAAPLLRSRRLAALAAVSLLASAAALATYSRIPVKSANLATLNYLDVLAFPVGVLSWLTVGSAVVLTGRQVTSRRRRGRPRPGSTAAGRARWRPAVGRPGRPGRRGGGGGAHRAGFVAGHSAAGAGGRCSAREPRRPGLAADRAGAARPAGSPYCCGPPGGSPKAADPGHRVGADSKRIPPAGQQPRRTRARTGVRIPRAADPAGDSTHTGQRPVGKRHQRYRQADMSVARSCVCRESRRGPDQQSCLLARPAVMIIGHVPAVRLYPGHAGGLLAAAVSA